MGAGQCPAGVQSGQARLHHCPAASPVVSITGSLAVFCSRCGCLCVCLGHAEAVRVEERVVGLHGRHFAARALLSQGGMRKNGSEKVVADTLAPAWGEPWTHSPSLSCAHLPTPGSPDQQHHSQPNTALLSFEKPGQGCKLPSYCWEKWFCLTQGRCSCCFHLFPLPRPPHPEGMKKGRNICRRETCSCLSALPQGKQSCMGMTFLSSWTPFRLRRSCRHRQTPAWGSAR